MFPCQPVAETGDRLIPKVGSGADKKESKRKTRVKLWGWAGRGMEQCTTGLGRGSSRTLKWGLGG